MFHHATLLIYVRRLGLELYQAGNDTPLIFPFPPELVRNLEVMNERGLSTAVQSFLQQNQVSHAVAAIVLSEDVLFHQVFAETDQAKRAQLEEEFLKNVPLDPAVTAHLTWLEADDRFHVYAVDKRLYAAVRTSIEHDQGEVGSVLPAFLFGIAENPQALFGQVAALTPDQVRMAMGEGHLHDQNLLAHEPQLPSEKKERAHFALPEEKKESSSKQNILAVVIFILFMVGVGVLLFLMLKRQSAQLKKPISSPVPSASLVPSIQPSPSPIATASPAATLSSLTVNILNASGKTGVAATVRDALSPLGFSQFTLGNASTTAGATTIVFSSKVPAETQTAVEVKVKQLSSQITSQQAASSAKFDIVITIAK